MSLVTNEIEALELDLMDQQSGFLHTFGPMALPIIFFVSPLINALILGVAINGWYNSNPPLIYGWNPAWGIVPLQYMAELNYWFKQYRIATNITWLTWRYWIGKRHFENDLKINHWNPIGRAVKMEKMEDGSVRLPIVRMSDTAEGRQPAQNGVKKDTPLSREELEKKVKEVIQGLDTGKYGFIKKPHLYVKAQGVNCDKLHTQSKTLLQLEPEKVCTDLTHVVDVAGDYLYEVFFDSEKFKVAIVCLPLPPDLMINDEGNIADVVQGGFIFTIKHIGAVSFVRCDHTQTATIPYIPIGVFTDYAALAQEVLEERATSYVGKEAIQVAALARDTHYADMYLRNWQDTEKILDNVRSQEVDLDKRVDQRVKVIAESNAKIRGGITRPPSPGSTGKSRGWIKWVVAISVIAGLLFVLRFA